MPKALKLEGFLKVNLFPPDPYFRDLKYIPILYKITFWRRESLIIMNFQHSALEKTNWGEVGEQKVFSRTSPA